MKQPSDEQFQTTLSSLLKGWREGWRDGFGAGQSSFLKYALDIAMAISAFDTSSSGSITRSNKALMSYSSMLQVSQNPKIATKMLGELAGGSFLGGPKSTPFLRIEEGQKHDLKRLITSIDTENTINSPESVANDLVVSIANQDMAAFEVAMQVGLALGHIFMTAIRAASALHVAAASGNLLIVKRLIDVGCGADQKAASDGKTPLLLAAEHGNLEVVQELVARGVDIDYGASNGVTPLFVAAANGHLEVVRYLLKEITDVNKAASADDNITPLLAAATEGYADIVQELCESDADVNKAMSDGTTPLLVAATKGYVDIVEILLQRRADVNQGKPDGTTALLTAILNNHTEIAVKLIDHGARCDINAPNHESVSILHIAIQSGNQEIVRKLVENSAKIDSGLIEYIKQRIGDSTQAEDLNNNKEILEIIGEELVKRAEDISQKTEEGSSNPSKLTIFNALAVVLTSLASAKMYNRVYASVLDVLRKEVLSQKRILSKQKDDVRTALNQHIKKLSDLRVETKQIEWQISDSQPNRLNLKLNFGERLNQKLKSHFLGIKHDNKNLFEIIANGNKDQYISITIDDSVIRNFNYYDAVIVPTPDMSSNLAVCKTLQDSSKIESLKINSGFLILMSSGQSRLEEFAKEERLEIDREQKAKAEEAAKIKLLTDQTRNKNLEIARLRIQLNAQTEELTRLTGILQTQLQRQQDEGSLDKLRGKITAQEDRIRDSQNQLDALQGKEPQKEDRQAAVASSKANSKPQSVASIKPQNSTASMGNEQLVAALPASMSTSPSPAASPRASEALHIELVSPKTTYGEEEVLLRNLLLGSFFKSGPRSDIQGAESTDFYHPKELLQYGRGYLKSLPEHRFEEFDRVFCSEAAKTSYQHYLQQKTGRDSTNPNPLDIAKHYFHSILEEIVDQVIPPDHTSQTNQADRTRTRNLIYFFLSYAVGDERAISESYDKLENQGKNYGARTGEAHASESDISSLKRSCLGLQFLREHLNQLEPRSGKQELENFLENYCLSRPVQAFPAMPAMELSEVYKEDFGLFSDLVNEFRKESSRNICGLVRAEESVKEFCLYNLNICLSEELTSEDDKARATRLSHKFYEKDFWQNLLTTEGGISDLQFIFELSKQNDRSSLETKEAAHSFSPQIKSHKFDDLKVALREIYNQESHKLQQNLQLKERGRAGIAR